MAMYGGVVRLVFVILFVGVKAGGHTYLRE